MSVGTHWLTVRSWAHSSMRARWFVLNRPFVKPKMPAQRLFTDGKRKDGKGHFVEPTIILADAALDVVKKETFAPILFIQSLMSSRGNFGQ